MADNKILIVDDEEFIRLNLGRIFKKEGFEVIPVSNGQDALKKVRADEFDLALLDLNLPDADGLEVLKQLKSIQPDLLVIVVTGFASLESAVGAIKLGAYDYVKKPFKADAIKLIARLALETRNLQKKVERLRRPVGSETILGKSPQIEKVKFQVEEFAKHDSETVLITGESGTGKELIGKALHHLSARREKDYVEINCASIPETLLETELFGHEKGAFTDARARKAGLLEKADGGTLLLDEIGEMSLSLQAKLLRVLEDKKFRRLGSTKDLVANVRVVAATNKNLMDAIAARQFREDLYYRLNVLRIDVPPLRERGEDVLLLAEHFCDHYNRKFGRGKKTFSDEARQAFLRYGWPGNVRELKNIVERIAILHKDELISAQHLPGEVVTDSMNNLGPDIQNQIKMNGDSLDSILEKVEKNLVKQAFIRSDRNTSKAARLLNIPRETLRYKLEKYSITNGE